MALLTATYGLPQTGGLVKHYTGARVYRVLAVQPLPAPVWAGNSRGYSWQATHRLLLLPLGRWRAGVWQPALGRAFSAPCVAHAPGARCGYMPCTASVQPWAGTCTPVGA